MGIAKQENQMNFQFILCILDSYYIAQAIIQLQLTWSIKINSVYKSRENHHIPALFTGQLESADISPYIEQITEEEPLTSNSPKTTICYFQRETKINLIQVFCIEGVHRMLLTFLPCPPLDWQDPALYPGFCNLSNLSQMLLLQMPA